MIGLQGRRLAACLLALVLSGCGGGGGSDAPTSGGAGGPPPATRSLTGTATVLASDGRIIDAAAGRVVLLAPLDAQGQIGEPIATTRTATDGTFKLELPAGVEPGASLALAMADDHQGQWRAIAMRDTVDIGPASEAFTQEFVAMRAARGSAFVEPVVRLVRFQHSATLMLRLLGPGGTDSAGALPRLRRWLLADPAVAGAFASLRDAGTLPATLGDIGGFAGFARGASDSVDSDGRHKMSVLPTPGTNDEWQIVDTLDGQMPSQPSTMRLEADAVTAVNIASQDSTSYVLLRLIGPHTVASFAIETGATKALTSVNRATTGYDFNGDTAEDQLSYRIDQTTRGIESISIFGATMDTLRIDFRTELVLTMSGTGRQVKVVETRSQWSLPFAGPVRTDTAIVATDEQGQATNLSSQRLAERVVVNDVSWPGRVRLSVSNLHEPASYQFTSPLAVTSDLRFLFGGYVPGECCLMDQGVSIRDLAAGNVIADVLIRHSTLQSRLFVSPDGSRVYMAMSKELPPETQGSPVAIDPARAAAYGATIIRYDARTMQEEARVVLPPLPSKLNPALAYARNHAPQLVISPSDPTHFVVAGLDALLVRDTTVAPLALEPVSSPEAALPGGGARILVNQVFLRGWDVGRNELWFEYNGGGPLGRVVPIAADGFRPEQVRDGVPALFALIASFDSWSTYDRITSDRIYLEGNTTVIDKATGALLRRLSQAGEPSYHGTQCAPRGMGIVCNSGYTLFLMTTDLQELSRVALQNDLRVMANGTAAAGLIDRIFVTADGSLIYMAYDLSKTDIYPNPRAAFRLEF